MPDQRQAFRKPEEKPPDENSSVVQRTEDELTQGDFENQESNKQLEETRLGQNRTTSDPNRDDKNAAQKNLDDPERILSDLSKDLDLKDSILRATDLEPWQIMLETAEIVRSESQHDLERNLLAPKQEGRRLTQEEPHAVLSNENRSVEPSHVQAHDRGGAERAAQTQDEYTQLIEHHEKITAWKAVKELDYQRDPELPDPVPSGQAVDQHPIKSTYEKNESERQANDKFALSAYKQEPIIGELEHTDKSGQSEQQREQVTCHVPEDLAYQLAGIGQLEPEAMTYLQEQYGYVEKFVSNEVKKDDEEFDRYKSNRASKHAEELRLLRDEVCPERSKRASLQIQQLESHINSRHIPALHDYVEITYRSNNQDACYELERVREVSRSEVSLPTSLQELLNCREEAEFKQMYERQQVQEHKIEIEQKQDIVKVIFIQKNIIHHEEIELEHIADEEPPPSGFCCLRFSDRGCELVKEFEARNWEEFDQQRMGFPPTDECRAHVDELDRIWKAWKDRVAYQRSELNRAGDKLVHYEYLEHNDYDR